MSRLPPLEPPYEPEIEDRLSAMMPPGVPPILLLLTEVILELVKDLRYTDEVSGSGTGFLVWRGRIGGQDIEGVDHLTVGPDGKIRR